MVSRLNFDKYLTSKYLIKSLKKLLSIFSESKIKNKNVTIFKIRSLDLSVTNILHLNIKLNENTNRNTKFLKRSLDSPVTIFLL